MQELRPSLHSQPTVTVITHFFYTFHLLELVIYLVS